MVARSTPTGGLGRKLAQEPPLPRRIRPPGCDTVETYLVNSANSGDALLSSIQARNGYTQTLQYNGRNQLVSVTDSYNRALNFTYMNNRLQTVTTPDGLILTYGFNSGGMLASVTYSTSPATVSIAAIAGGNATNSPQTLAVHLSVDAPVISQNGVVNGASFSTTAIVSPGSIASLFGSNLSSTTAEAGAPIELSTLAEKEDAPAAGVTLPTTLGGTQVLVNGVAAGLFYVSPTQVNFEMPLGLSGLTAQVVVVSGGVSGLTAAVKVQAALPGIFTANSSGSGQGAIFIATSGEYAAPSGSITGLSARPAQPGEFISMYCTGLGPATNQPPSGAAASDNPLSVTTVTPSVTIGNILATVSFSGLAPSFVGLNQVNVQVPQNAPRGDAVPVVLAAESNASNTVTIAIQ